jgi:hypothetical protein
MYVFQVASMDWDTQKQGLHLIMHRLFSVDSAVGSVDEDAWTVDVNERQMFQRFFACAPVRCSTIHINTPSPEKWVRILPSVIQMLGKDERGRILFHEGKLLGGWAFGQRDANVHAVAVPCSSNPFS